MLPNKQDSDRRVAPSYESMLNYTRRVQDYVLNDDFKIF
jgi:hypothetical protein